MVTRYAFSVGNVFASVLYHEEGRKEGARGPGPQYNMIMAQR